MKLCHQSPAAGEGAAQPPALQNARTVCPICHSDLKWLPQLPAAFFSIRQHEHSVPRGPRLVYPVLLEDKANFWRRFFPYRRVSTLSNPGMGGAQSEERPRQGPRFELAVQENSGAQCFLSRLRPKTKSATSARLVRGHGVGRAACGAAFQSSAVANDGSSRCNPKEGTGSAPGRIRPAPAEMPRRLMAFQLRPRRTRARPRVHSWKSARARCGGRARAVGQALFTSRRAPCGGARERRAPMFAR